MSKILSAAALVIGPKSQMKKKFLDSQKLFDRICPSEKLNMYLGSTHDMVLLKPQGLEMDLDSIQQSLTKLNSILDLGFQSLRMIFFVVKFDRIDNMITIIKPLLMKFIKYSKNTTLVITGIDYSCQQEQDRELLIKNVVKYFKLQNYIICGSTEDVSSQILDKMTSVSNWQLDLKNLNLLPGKVDEAQLKELKEKFQPRREDNTNNYDYVKQPSQIRKFEQQKNIPQSEIIGINKQQTFIAQQVPQFIQSNQPDINTNSNQANDGQKYQPKIYQSQIVGVQIHTKNYPNAEVNITLNQSGQQSQIQKNQSNIQQRQQTQQKRQSK